MTSSKKLLRIVALLCCLMVGIAVLFGCGDSETTENITQNYTTSPDVVPTVTELSECSAVNAGEVYLVKTEGFFYGCNGVEWKKLGQPSSDTVLVVESDSFYVSVVDTLLILKNDTLYVVTAADYSCESKVSEDGIRVVIYCGGDSIGVVYNGEKGDPGEKGNPGAAGAVGATGAQGEQGIQGEKGDIGVSGVGCSIESTTKTSVTIKCGEDSFTMNLNGPLEGYSSSEEPSSSSSSAYEIENVLVTGVAQKGPFMKNSKITLYELNGNNSLTRTGNTFEGVVSADDGKFAINEVSLISGDVNLEVSGTYRNEITGENSDASITLNAYANLTGRQNVNVNVLTHLESFRVKYLMNGNDEKLDVNKAKKLAQKEILSSVFDVDASLYDNSENLDIWGSSEGDAALLALSIILQGDRDASCLKTLLNAFGQDIQTDGTWDGSISNSIKNWRDSIADWALEKDQLNSFSKIRSNMKNWNLNKTVPDFEKFIRKYYGMELGIGVCGEDVVLGSVKNISNAQSKHYASSYASSAEKGGMVRYICAEADSLGNTYAQTEGPKWRIATNIEKDTIGLKHGSTTIHDQASVIKGLVNKNFVYVYEGSSFRRGTASDISLGLNGCTASRRDTVAKSGNEWYKCAADAAVVLDGNAIAQTWRVASTIEKDTAGWSFDGPYDDAMVKKGNVTDTQYYYQKNLNQWRIATQLEYHVYNKGDDIDWTVDTTDGAYKMGKNSGNAYVYDSENGGWRSATTTMDYSNGIDGCTKARADANYKARSLIAEDSYVYSCEFVDSDYKWVKSTDALVNDIYGETCPKADGGLFSGRITKTNKYVCEDGSFRIAVASDIVTAHCENGDLAFYKNKEYECVNSSYTYNGKSLMADDRDSSVYQIVTIGSLTWMAENLNYTPDTTNSIYFGYKGRTWCYGNNTDSCAKYGRLYTWAAAMDSAGVFSMSSAGCGYDKTCSVTNPARGICPVGWHLPDGREWYSLYKISSGATLKSSVGWNGEKNGIDSYGFSVLPAGYGGHNSFRYVGETAYFWSAVEDDETWAGYWCFDCYGEEEMFEDFTSKGVGYSIRCVKNSN